MKNYIYELDNLFSKLYQTELAYIDFDNNGIYYRQESKTTVLPDIYFDIKKPNFLVPKDIQKNVHVLSKLKQYEDTCLITCTPDDTGYYFQVFNKLGILVYAQKIKFFSLSGLSLWWAKKRFPELTLKVKKF